MPKRSFFKIKTVSAIVAVLSMLVLSSCSLFWNGETALTDPPVTTLPYSPETTVPSITGDSANSTASPDVTDVPLTPDTTGLGDETTAPVQVKKYLNPLTGLEGDVDLRKIIPISVLLDNISVAAPQSGISKADILIEVPVEGGITRLIMITNNYGNDEVFGPVRSARHYTVSLSQAFGTLMVGAGGSPLAYTMIQSLGLPYLDGVNDRYSGSGYYRDPLRVESSGAVHALMTSGNRILKLASIHGWATESASVAGNAFVFANEGQKPTASGSDSMHILIPYSSSQYVQLIYSKTTGTYYRFQLGDRAHLDADNGEQLSFKNVFVLFAESERIPDDTEGRIDVVTTGEGTGYYISDGKSLPIKWSRVGDTSAFVFTDENGVVLKINRGKTFISIAPKWLEAQIELNYGDDFSE